ncbi:MAG: hypothetical protein QME60_08285 [Verrucomicrobiota bacterium]|nr:hypothetical protein [Verrucomicrobiota bacterium]
MFKKPSAVRRRLKEVRKELSLLDSGIRTLSRRPASAAPRPLSARVLQDEAPGADDRSKPFAPRGEPAEKASPGVDTRDKRFAEYLAKSFQPERPLARERNIRRNKAIVMAVFVLVALAMLLYRLLAW